MLASEALLGLLDSDEFIQFSPEAKEGYRKASDEVWNSIPDNIQCLDWDTIDDYIVIPMCDDDVGMLNSYGYSVIPAMSEEDAITQVVDDISTWIASSGYVPPDDDEVTQQASKKLGPDDDPEAIFATHIEDWGKSGCKITFVGNPVCKLPLI
jgi:hypothetical protein